MYVLFATTNVLYLGICNQPKLAYPINGCMFTRGHSLIPYSMFGFIDHEWEHGHEIQTPQCRVPQTVSYSLYCLCLLQLIIDPLWSTPPTALLDWPAVHQRTGPVNQPQPIPACVVHVCYLTTTRAPAETVKKTTLVCIWVEIEQSTTMYKSMYKV